MVKKKIVDKLPLFAVEDALVNGIMGQPPIKFGHDEDPFSYISATCGNTLDHTLLLQYRDNRSPIVLDPKYLSESLPDRDIVGIELPAHLPQMEALGTDGVLPQMALDEELHRHIGLRPGADYTLIGVQDAQSTRALQTGVPDEYLLLLNKRAYRDVALAALGDLVEPTVGALITHPQRLDACRHMVKKGGLAKPFIIAHSVDKATQDDYRREMQDPDSPVSKLINSIMANAEIPDLDAKAIAEHAAARENYEAAGAIVRPRPSNFSTHVLSRRAQKSTDDNLPPH